MARGGKVIIPAGTDVWPHELETAEALAAAGFEVEFVRRTEGKGAKSADVVIDGVLWEMKAPESSGEKSLDRVLRRASRQSPNVIVDAARMRRCTDRTAERDLRKLFPLISGLRRLLLVKKCREVLVIK